MWVVFINFLGVKNPKGVLSKVVGANIHAYLRLGLKISVILFRHKATMNFQMFFCVHREHGGINSRPSNRVET